MLTQADKHRIAKYYNLDLEKALFHNVAGGDVNTTFLIETSRGKFILKKIHFGQYIKEYRTSVHEVIQSIHFSESVCRAFAFTEHVVPAITGENGVLLNNQQYGYLLYPFVSGSILENTQITHAMVTKIANMLATIHNSPIVYDKIFSEKKRYRYKEAGLAILNNRHLEKLRYLGRLLPWSRRLSRAVRYLIHNREAFKDAIHSMAKDSVCHNDLKPKNVLWKDEREFWVIDWEAAADFDFKVDYLDTLISWCKEDSGSTLGIHLDKVRAFTDAYPIPKGTKDKNTLLLVLLKWYFWLYFCISRAFKKPREFRHYYYHAKQALRIIDFLIEHSDLSFLDKTA